MGEEEETLLFVGWGWVGNVPGMSSPYYHNKTKNCTDDEQYYIRSIKSEFGTGDGQTSPSTLQRCFVFKQPFMSVGTIGDLSLEDQYRITTITTTTTATITMTPAAVD